MPRTAPRRARPTELTSLLDPASPQTYPRRALVCVAGLSPPVVTETLYALAVQERPAFVPTELHIITTARGKKTLEATLLKGADGPLGALFAEYLPGHSMQFDAQHVHQITRDGKALDDIDSHEDSTAASNTILGVVRALALDANCAIHASIAGGRKTMGGALQNVMALLGRPQDRMSHVLVNAPFETLPTFFYPPKVPVELVPQVRPPTTPAPSVSTADAKIILARVSLVRVSDGLGARLLTGSTEFEELVELAQIELTRPTVYVHPSRRAICIGHKVCTLTEHQMFWYLLLAIRRIECLQEPGLTKPGAIRIDKVDSLNKGLDGPPVATVKARMQSIEVDLLRDLPGTFKPIMSSLNKELDRVFGPHLALRAHIVGPGKSGAKDKQYGLFNIEPDALHVV